MKILKISTSVLLGIVILDVLLPLYPAAAERVTGMWEYLIFAGTAVCLVFGTAKRRPFFPGINAKREYIISGSGELTVEFDQLEHPDFTVIGKSGNEKTYANDSSSLIITRMAYPPGIRNQYAGSESPYWLLWKCLMVSMAGVIVLHTLHIYRLPLIRMRLLQEANAARLSNIPATLSKRVACLVLALKEAVDSVRTASWNACIQHILKNWQYLREQFRWIVS